MLTAVVRDVRARLAEEQRPLTTIERTLLLATLARPSEGGEELLDELGDAIVELRRSAFAHGSTVDPLTLLAVRRMLAAAAALLDYVPRPPQRVLEPPVSAGPARPWRADVDG